MPAVEHLLNDKHSLLIADIDQILSRRVVRHTDGVTAHVLQNLYLTLNGSVPGLRAQRALIVVHTNALQLHVLSVQGETSTAVKIKVTETEIRGRYVCSRSCADGCLHHVKLRIRIIQSPEIGIGRSHIALHRHSRSAGYLNRICRNLANRSLAVIVLPVNPMRYCDLSLRSGLVLNGSLHMDGRIALIGLQIRKLHLRSVQRLVYHRRDGQLHISVNTAS